MAAISLICAGSFNSVARAAASTSGNVTTSDNNSLFPPSKLYDGLSSQAFRFSTTSSGTMSVNLNLVQNGGAEVAGLSPWTVTGAVTQTSARQSSGTYSFLIAGTSSSAYEDVEARSGERFTVSIAGSGDSATASRPRLEVRNLKTFNYLTSSGGWQAAQTYALNGSATSSWSTTSLVTTIEAYGSSVLRDTMTLRMRMYSSAAASAYVDDVKYFPSSTLVALTGFLNLDPGIAVYVHSSSDNFTTTTTEATVTQRTPSMFYYTSTPIDRQYIRVYLAGVNSTGSGAIYGGEWVVAQPDAITRPHDQNKVMPMMDSQLRQQTALGEERVYRQSAHPIRRVTMPYKFTTLAEYTQVRDLVRRTQVGALPALVIPCSTDLDVCVLGLLEPQWVVTEWNPGWWENSSLVVTEKPFPVWVQ